MLQVPINHICLSLHWELITKKDGKKKEYGSLIQLIKMLDSALWGYVSNIRLVHNEVGKHFTDMIA